MSQAAVPVEALLVASTLFSALALALCIYIAIRVGRNGSMLPRLWDSKIANVEAAITRSDLTTRSEFSQNREESGRDARSLREEVTKSVSALADSLRQSF